MKTVVKPISIGLVGLLVIVGGLYLAGYKVKLVSRSGQEIAQGGGGKKAPGWRRAQGGQAVSPQAGGQQGGGQSMAAGGRQGRGQQGRGQQGRGQTGGGGPGGGGQGQQMAQAGQPGQQPGFGPSGGILLPMRPGTDSIPVVFNGVQKASFVGKDLMDKVEDTVIATAEGPRKGWGVGKVVAYLGLKNVKEVALYDKNGKKVIVSSEQMKDEKTFVLLTYDAKGSLLLSSGPKVRGSSKGMTPREQVIKMVEGRKDLISLPNIVRMEVKG